MQSRAYPADSLLGALVRTALLAGVKAPAETRVLNALKRPGLGNQAQDLQATSPSYGRATSDGRGSPLLLSAVGTIDVECSQRKPWKTRGSSVTGCAQRLWAPWLA